MPTTPFLRQCGLLVATAAAPIPLLLIAQVIARSDCLWWFLSSLAVAIVASRVMLSTTPSMRGWARTGPWVFRRRVDRDRR